MSTPPSPVPPAYSSTSVIGVPNDVPHLDSEGTNWATFAFRFRRAMILVNRWDFYDGSNKRPTPKDPDNPTDAEKKECQKWDREDQIAQCLLSQRLPDELAMDMDNLNHTTAKKQWDAINTYFTAKSVYAKADLHQAFLDMRCPKGGDVREFLTNLRKKRHELKAAEVTVTDAEYERTILRGIPDTLAVYASQTLSTLRLAVKYTGKPVDMSDVIDSVCEEADRIKTRRTLKDQSQGQGRGKRGGQTDEALAATTSERGRGKCRNGKCNHCGKEGHWIRECRTKKREEAAARNQNQGGQAAQADSTRSSKPENKPVGSANVVTVDDSDDDGFCLAEEEVVHARIGCAEPDPLLDDPEWDDNLEREDFRAEPEATEERSDKLDNEGEAFNVEIAAAVITPVEVDAGPRIELYDSGSSRHISPHKADFSSFTTLSPPLYLNAANQHKFPAIGTEHSSSAPLSTAAKPNSSSTTRCTRPQSATPWCPLGH